MSPAKNQRLNLKQKKVNSFVEMYTNDKYKSLPIFVLKLSLNIFVKLSFLFKKDYWCRVKFSCDLRHAYPRV